MVGNQRSMLNNTGGEFNSSIHFTIDDNSAEIENAANTSSLRGQNQSFLRMSQNALAGSLQADNSDREARTGSDL